MWNVTPNSLTAVVVSDVLNGVAFTRVTCKISLLYKQSVFVRFDPVCRLFNSWSALFYVCT